VLLLFVVATATPALLTPLDWDRYYLLPLFFSTALIAAGLTWPARFIASRLAPDARE
jgi:hypothetical protein